MKAIVKQSGIELANKLNIASSLFMRMKGLLGRKDLSSGEGLWLKPCKGVHSFGMRFAIDVVVLDRNLGVIAIINSLQPNRTTGIFRKAETILELPACSVASCGLKTGDTVEMIL